MRTTSRPSAAALLAILSVIGAGCVSGDRDSAPGEGDLSVSDGSPPNIGSDRVHWDNLTGVPTDFADGVDSGTTYIAGTGVLLTGSGTSTAINVLFSGSGAQNFAARADHDHNATYVNTTGDTMTGPLTLSGDPTSNLHAATRQYVDTNIAAAGGGDITGVVAGAGITGGGTIGDVTVSAAFAGTGTTNTVARSDHDHDTRYHTQSTLETPGVINASGNPVDWSNLKNVPAGFADGVDDEATLTAGTGIDVTGGLISVDLATSDGTPPNVGSNVVHWDNLTGTPVGSADGDILVWNTSTLRWDLQSAPGGGDILGVIAGSGLTGGGTVGTVTLDVDFAGTGTATTAARSDHHHDTAYVNEGQADAITSGMIADGQITDADVSATAGIDPAKISGTAWTAATDGSGSGLDADTLDGLTSADFMAATADDWVDVTGDTMSGALTLAADPTAAMEAATKQYVDNSIAAAPGGDVTAVNTTAPLSGGAASGDVTLSIAQATTTTNGYLSSADWNTFNGKLGSEADTLQTVCARGSAYTGTLTSAALSSTELTSRNPGESLLVKADDGTADGGTLTVRAGTAGSATGGAGGDLVLQSGGNMPQGGGGYTNLGPAGDVSITAGLGYNSVGGNVTITSGATSYWSTTATGHSAVTLQGGHVDGPATGGATLVVEGGVDESDTSSHCIGGDVTITAGSGSAGYAGGNVVIQGGTGTPAGNVGINTAAPTATLDVNGTARVAALQVTTGATNGHVLTSDASGNATWQAPGASTGWALTGNAGTTAGTNFLGTTDDQALEIKVNGSRAARYEPDATCPNVVCGSQYNYVQSGQHGAVVCGGGQLGLGNGALGSFTVIGGGYWNTTGADGAIIVGGVENTASGLWSTICGGGQNTTGGAHAAVGGGEYNGAGGSHATVPGGLSNSAQGDYSLAAGRRAKANDIGSFAWADSNDIDFASAAANEFAARATGGVRFVTAIDGAGVPTAGVSLAAGGTSWATISDRNKKKDFQRVDGEELLKGIARLDIPTWHYAWERDEDARHIGPMAQDFHATFGVGAHDTVITTQEAEGVALAAAKALEKRTSDLRDENASLRSELVELRNQLAALRELVAETHAAK